MLELGQPLHAFDLRKIAGAKIVVRRATAGEHIRTIDGVDRPLTEDTLVIADATKPVAVAGVMGGGDSEVTEATTLVLLEAACFSQVSVRSTSTRLGLRSEASSRFEKGLHPELAIIAARRAMRLLIEIAGGRACKGLVDVYPAKRQDTRVVVTRGRIEQVLGADPSTSQVRGALTDLGFGCRWVPPDRYVVRVPYWRTDIGFADDVIEELARVMGYDKIEPEPLKGGIPKPVIDPVRRLRESLRDAAVAAGLQEVMTYPLTTVESLARVESELDIKFYPPLRLENPMSSEQSVLRTSLRGSLLSTLAHNLRFQETEAALFECARIYLAREGDLPEEKEQLAGVIAGKRLGRWGEATKEDVDFYDAKGRVEEMLELAGLDLQFRPGQSAGLIGGRTAELLGRGEPVGVLGQVHPAVASAFEVDGPAFLFELDIEKLQAAALGLVRHAPISRFPVATQDLALLVDRDVGADRIAALIEENPLVTKAQLFDIYEDDSLPAGKRSLAFAVHFQALDRTLTEREVADARNRIVRRLQHETGAELRGG
jgi:phenylalanyl-tRNA synthetase beta chain